MVFTLCRIVGQDAVPRMLNLDREGGMDRTAFVQLATSVSGTVTQSRVLPARNEGPSGRLEPEPSVR